MIGQTIAHYKIIEKLGEGGMGEVFLAEDTKLERRVALKFLPQSLTKNPEARQRLIREAKAASKLNHPNILTIHAVESVDDRDFIAMEYVDGHDLSEYLKAHPLTLEEKLSLAIQIAEGLGKAHSAGVIHRDIKPSNILVDEDGRPRLLDFGLATFEGATRLTQTGSTVGTAAYMSPEQASGRECDHRSDLFSLGVVLYEMATDRLPFQGAHNAALMYAIVNEDPQPIARFVSSTPDELQRIVTKSLSKHTGERYQSAADLISDLKRLLRTSSSGGEQAVAARRKMLAVLPFENLGPADDEYFADGITEEIISRLSAVKAIGVISRTSVMQFKGTKKAIRDIGGELGVDYILEGTVRWGKGAQGVSRVRITPQLIQVNEDTHLWSDRYDRVIEDIFDVQSDIAARVTDQLNIKLADSERRVIEAKPTENVDAYNAYLRGLERFNSSDSTAEVCRTAVQMFERAVSLDPQFAQAHAYLSIAHAEMYWYGHDRSPERAQKAKKSAERAETLARDDAATPMAHGFYRYKCEFDFKDAMLDFQKSIDRQPNNSIPLFMIAMCQRRLGQFSDSIATSRRVLALDPLGALYFAETGITAAMMRRFSEALELLDRSISLQPDQTHAYHWKCGIQLYGLGATNDARRTLEMAGEVNREQMFENWFDLLLAERNRDAALELIQQLKGEAFEDQGSYVPKTLLRAEVQSLLGNAGEAGVDYQSALSGYELAFLTTPDDLRMRMGRAFALAGVGRIDEAYQQARAVIETREIAEDMMAKPVFQLQQATIHARGGDHGTALGMIEYLLSIPSPLSSGHLRIMPYWDSLRGNPEFERLINLPPKVF